MPKKIYAGIENIGDRKIKKIYYGDAQGLAKMHKKAYIGDKNGKARLVFVACEHKNIAWWYNGDDEGNYNTHREVCIDCNEVLVPSEACSISAGWEYDATHHWDYCVKCGNTHTIEEHTLQTHNTEPTCTEAGDSYESCSFCGYQSEPISIPPLGHNYTFESHSDYGVHDVFCSRCGQGDQHPCHFENGVCDICGGSCSHLNCSSYTSNGERSGHTGICDICGEAVTESHNYTTVYDEFGTPEIYIDDEGKSFYVYICLKCGQYDYDLI
jgi:hypothetical protein